MKLKWDHEAMFEWLKKRFIKEQKRFRTELLLLSWKPVREFPSLRFGGALDLHSLGIHHTQPFIIAAFQMEIFTQRVNHSIITSLI